MKTSIKILIISATAFLLCVCSSRKTLYITKDITLVGIENRYYKKIHIKPDNPAVGLTITVKPNTKAILGCKKLYVDGKVTIDFEKGECKEQPKLGNGSLKGVITVLSSFNVKDKVENDKKLSVEHTKLDLDNLLINGSIKNPKFDGEIKFSFGDIKEQIKAKDTLNFDGKKVLVNYDSLITIFQKLIVSPCTNCPPPSCFEIKYQRIKSKSWKEKNQMEWIQRTGDSNANLILFNLR